MSDAGDQTPAAFLSHLAQRLRDRDGVDRDVAEILARHILTAQPAKDAAGDAHKAAIALAAQRSAPSDGGADD